MAKIAADKAIAQAQLQLQAQLGQQSNALNLLGLGLQDYQNMLNRQLGTATLPFNLLGQVMGLPSIGSGSSKGSL
jgi:beta-lactamase class A